MPQIMFKLASFLSKDHSFSHFKFCDSQQVSWIARSICLRGATLKTIISQIKNIRKEVTYRREVCSWDKLASFQFGLELDIPLSYHLCGESENPVCFSSS